MGIYLAKTPKTVYKISLNAQSMGNACLINTMTLPTSKSALRKQLNRQRQRLTVSERQRASHLAVRQLHHIAQQFCLPKQAKIAVFVDAFGELPTQSLIDWATRQGFAIYLPVVTHPHQPLTFIQLAPTHLRKARLCRHAFGMRQPKKGRQLSAKKMDMIVVPLVAIDKQGYRMGMGGGFYDRTLAKTKTKPLTIGWAYDFQWVAQLPHEAWDIRLDGLVTPSHSVWFRRY
ncbi:MULTISPECIES: 5-formyltetrahydrofolate cyclo-ligase [unclassified Moraxella]|uniref:5-formyltetrahydrofolate cyclo-ligase n=1 Tax=unclassified Moraxella TaxID=2685852 RepID=UPI003AF507D0